MQLLQGHYASELVEVVQNQGINGLIFYAKAMQLCWQYVQTSWQECNQALHDNAEPYNMSQMCIIMQHIFHDATRHPHTEATIRDQTIESILAWPIHSIVSWAQCSAMHICNHAKAAATQAWINNTDIWSFFRPKLPPVTAPSTDKNLLQPP